MGVNERYYLGKITKVEDRELYKVRVTIDKVVDDAMAFPLRGEVDEPKIGDLVLLYNIDDIFQSCYLYSKIKEDTFLGFRSNGKIISITKDNIRIATYEIDEEDATKDETEKVFSEIILDNKGNISITTTKDAEEGNLNISVNKNCEVTIKGSCTLTCPDITISSDTSITIEGGATVTMDGTVGANPNGPFCQIPTCPFAGIPHTLSTVVTK